MILRQHNHQRLGPDRTSVVVGQFGSPRHKRHIQLIGAKLHYRFAGRAFGDFDLNVGMVFAVLRDQFGEKAARHQGMDTDAQSAALSRRRHTSSLHRMVELSDADRDPLDKEAPGLGEADASGIALEQKDAEVLLQRLDPRADVRLAGAERLGGAVEAEMFGDGKRLDQRCKWNAPQTKLMAWRI